MLLKAPIYLLCAALMLMTPPFAVAATSDQPLLRHGVYALPVSLDPAWGTTVGDVMLKANIYEGLTTYDAAGNVVPGAAQRWEVSDDGLHYTFHLRKGLRWSDGSPLTAQQFANTVLRVFQGKGDSQPKFSFILLKNANEIVQKQKPLAALGMKVIDPHTLRFELTRPAPYFPKTLVAFSLPTPGLMDDTLLLEELKPAQWITNGAYQVSTYNRQTRQYQFTKNPFYRDSENIHFQTVELQHFLNPNQAFFALFKGRLDSYGRYGGGQLKAIKAEKALIKVIPLGIASTDYLTMNMDDATLKNRQVRRALSMALDRSAIVQALGYSDTQRAFSFSPDYSGLNWQKLPPVWGKETLSSRRQRALKLMTDAGYGLNKRLKLEFLVNYGDANELVAEFVQRQWSTIGVDLKIISHTTALHYDKYLRTGRFQVARAGWVADYPDPSNFLEVLQQQQKSNFGRWKHTAYAQQLNQLLQQPLTAEQRSAAFLTLETIIQQEVPIIPVYNKANVILLAPWLKTVNQQQADQLLWRHLRPEGKPE